MSKNGLIQIAGIRDAEEARLLVEGGVDWLGFPFRLDFHREDLSETQARDIISVLPNTVLPVLITYLNDADSILDLCGCLGTRAVQLHGKVVPELGEALRRRSPRLALIKSLVVRENAWERLEKELQDWASWADYFLTDTFDAESGASGATGKTHDWEISRRLVEISPKPLMLAGGLNPDNVGEAIRKVRPAGVDSHTGVEDSQGAKDPELLRAFVAEARLAFAQL
ncbi:MAG: phosphoribosylanthranilate isomerase [Deltaproteobacteria bacterium]|nr:phosphoribosylanthranilate isomerase [Deltaproteobacteria bacterium]